jgi:uncharacterized protein (TIGR00304 family)
MLSAFPLALLGLSLILLGMLILRSPAEEKTYAVDANQGRPDLKEKRTEVKGGAVVMIGPIPIVVGSDSRTALLLMLMVVGVMLFWFIMVGLSWR